jgi:AmmeMemoRadiSam system protein B
VTDQSDSLDIRPSPIAGTWYPGDPENLAISIDQFLDDAKPKDIDGEIVGLIVPHAGHRYSGAVAAQAFRQIRGIQPEVVAVISPLHVPADEAVLTSDHQAYSTPLGTINIDMELLTRLENSLQEEHGLRLGRLRYDREHSLEIELPFLQRCIDTPFKLIPIMLRDQVLNVSQAVGQSLGSLLQDQNCLIVGSSDLSHFYPQELAECLDQAVLDRIDHFDPAGVIRVEEEGKGFACGRGAIATTLWACQSLGADQVSLLKYATSGDITGDYASVVGYGSAMIVRQH